MIDAVKLKNLSTGSEIELTKSMDSAYLLETDGIDWGSAGATHSSYTNLTSVGNIITATKINSRTISFTGRICSKHTNREIAELYHISKRSEIAEMKLSEIEASKKVLSQLVNPIDYIRVTAGDFFIDGKADSSVVFSKNWKENNEVYCKFTFSITCEAPLFKYALAQITPLRGTYGGFHFPLTIPKNRGMHFGNIIAYQLMTVENIGDVAIGGVIHIKAKGTLVNPSFTNVYTQESIQIHKTLSEGEVIKIDTINRTVIGSTDGKNFTSYLQYWDFSNTWFQFVVGNTLFGYSADDDTQENMDIWIELNNSFYSMEDQ